MFKKENKNVTEVIKKDILKENNLVKCEKCGVVLDKDKAKLVYRLNGNFSKFSDLFDVENVKSYYCCQKCAPNYDVFGSFYSSVGGVGASCMEEYYKLIRVDKNGKPLKEEKK